MPLSSNSGTAAPDFFALADALEMAVQAAAAEATRLVRDKPLLESGREDMGARARWLEDMAGTVQGAVEALRDYRLARAEDDGLAG